MSGINVPARGPVGWIAAFSLFFMASCAASGGNGFRPVKPIAPHLMGEPTESAVVLDDDATVRLAPGSGGQIKALVRRRTVIQVLTAEGLRFANFKRALDGFHTVTSVRARVVHPDGSSRVMPREAIELRTWPEVSPDNPDVRRLWFTVPDVRVGSVIEVLQEEVYLDVDFLPPWVFGHELRMLRASLRVEVPDAFEIDMRLNRGPETLDTLPQRFPYEGGASLVFVEQDLSPLPQRADEGHPAWVGKWALLRVTKYRGEERLRTWDAVADKALDLMERSRGPMATGGVRARFDAIRDRLTPIRLPGLGVRAPQPESELLSGEPACGRDATALLWGAFSGFLDATPALLAGYDSAPVVPGAPGFYPFQAAALAIQPPRQIDRSLACDETSYPSMLCRAPATGWVFLDPMCSECRVGELPRRQTGARALLLRGGASDWAEVPANPFSEGTERKSLYLELSDSGEIVGRVQSRFAGTFAQLGRRRLARKQAWPRDIGVFHIDEQTTDNLNNRSQELEVRQRVRASLGKNAEDVAVSAEDLLGPAFPRELPRSRIGASWVGPWRREAEARLRLPLDRMAVVPPPATVREPGLEYRLEWRNLGEMLEIRRWIDIDRHALLPDEWRAFADWVARVRKAERSAMTVQIQPEINRIR